MPRPFFARVRAQRQRIFRSSHAATPRRRDARQRTPAANGAALEQRARVLVARRQIGDVVADVDRLQSQRHRVGRAADIAIVAVTEMAFGAHAYDERDQRTTAIRRRCVTTLAFGGASAKRSR